MEAVEFLDRVFLMSDDSLIFQTHTSIAVQCRCGTRIPPGGTVFGLAVVPRSLKDLFRGGIFCSVRCVRAFCLETLEILDSLDTPATRLMVTDLQDVHRAVAETLIVLQGWSGV